MNDYFFDFFGGGVGGVLRRSRENLRVMENRRKVFGWNNYGIGWYHWIIPS